MISFENKEIFIYLNYYATYVTKDGSIGVKKNIDNEILRRRLTVDVGFQLIRNEIEV